MKIKHLLLPGLIAILAGCSSAYRIGQTPDDVYYSPAPPAQEEYVAKDNQQDRDSYAYNNSGNNIEDLAIRRGINNPQFRNNVTFDLGGGYYPYDTYGSSFYNPYNSYYNSYNSFYSPYNSYYNPFYTGVTFYPYSNYYNSFYSPFNNYYSPYYNSYYPPLYYVTKPGIPASNYSGPRQYNLHPYNVTTNNTVTPATNTTVPSSAPIRTFQPRPNTTGVGNFVRRIFTPSGNNNTRSNNNYNRGNNDYNTRNDNAPARTFQPNTSSGNNSSSSSGSSGGSAPVRTFRH